MSRRLGMGVDLPRMGLGGVKAEMEPVADGGVARWTGGGGGSDGRTSCGDILAKRGAGAAAPS